jgi:hypothetical protein
MARHRSHSIAFKRQVAQEFVAGLTLLALTSSCVDGLLEVGRRRECLALERPKALDPDGREAHLVVLGNPASENAHEPGLAQTL